MGIKKYNPYTPSRRNMTGSDFSEITKKTPEKSLLVAIPKTAGRNNQGKITVRHIGGGSKKKYTFLVHTEANKSQIKEAVEKMFAGTKVKRVNTVNYDGKSKRRGATVGKTAATKKAVVWLTEDSKDIEIFAGL